MCLAALFTFLVCDFLGTKDNCATDAGTTVIHHSGALQLGSLAQTLRQMVVRDFYKAMAANLQILSTAVSCTSSVVSPCSLPDIVSCSKRCLLSHCLLDAYPLLIGTHSTP